MRWILSFILWAGSVAAFAQTVERQKESNNCVVFTLRVGSQGTVQRRICNTAEEAPDDPVKRRSSRSPGRYFNEIW